MTDAEPTYSAKQVASRVGTDAKQLRKFFRDEKSGYTPVGQGGRYDFPASELEKIREAFAAWSSKKTTRNRTTAPAQNASPAKPTIPGQRKDSPTPKVKRDPKAGLHGNPLDDDDLRTRMKGIKARVEMHGLTTDRRGAFKPLPKKEEVPGLMEALERIETAKEHPMTIMSNDDVNAHEKWLHEAIEDPDAPGVELELEDDGDLLDTNEDEGWDYEDEDEDDGEI